MLIILFQLKMASLLFNFKRVYQKYEDENTEFDPSYFNLEKKKTFTQFEAKYYIVQFRHQNNYQ